MTSYTYLKKKNVLKLLELQLQFFPFYSCESIFASYLQVLMVVIFLND